MILINSDFLAIFQQLFLLLSFSALLSGCRKEFFHIKNLDDGKKDVRSESRMVCMSSVLIDTAELRRERWQLGASKSARSSMAN
jgi:hypothetical protein